MLSFLFYLLAILIQGLHQFRSTVLPGRYALKTKTKLNSIHHLKEHANDYNNLVEKDLDNININSNPSIYWTTIVDLCINNSESLKPNTDKKI